MTLYIALALTLVAWIVVAGLILAALLIASRTPQTMSYEQTFLAAIDDMNAGQLHAPEHYLRTVPAARHEEFTRRLAALIVVRGAADADLTSGAFEAALAAVRGD